MEKAPVYIVDIIGEVVAATDAALRAKSDSWLTLNDRHINYVYGSESHVTQRLLEIGSNPNKSGTAKTPLVALMMPISTKRGYSNGFYGEANLPWIYIAERSDNTRLPPAKYADNFKPILFPIYYELLKQLARRTDVINVGGADFLSHTLWEYPAEVTAKANTIFTDFLDILAIQGLSFTIKQPPLVSCAK